MNHSHGLFPKFKQRRYFFRQNHLTSTQLGMCSSSCIRDRAAGRSQAKLPEDWGVRWRGIGSHGGGGGGGEEEAEAESRRRRRRRRKRSRGRRRSDGTGSRSRNLSDSLLKQYTNEMLTLQLPLFHLSLSPSLPYLLFIHLPGHPNPILMLISPRSAESPGNVKRHRSMSGIQTFVPNHASLTRCSKPPVLNRVML